MGADGPVIGTPSTITGEPEEPAGSVELAEKESVRGVS